MQGTPLTQPSDPAPAKDAPAVGTGAPPPSKASKEPAVLSYAVSRDIFLHPSASRPVWVRYSMALVMVLAAWGVTLLLSPIVSRPVSGLFYLAVIFSAYYGGLGPALLGTLLAALLTALFFMPPAGSVQIDLEDAVLLGVFLATAVVVSSLTASRRRAEDALRRAHDELERRVRSRTSELQAANEALHLQIAERKRAEDALRQSEERVRLLVEGVEDYAVFMLDADGCVASWNTGAARILGFEEGEVSGEHFRCFSATEDAQRGKPEDELNSAATLGRAEDEGWRVRKDGSRFWANVIVTALRDESGNLRGFATVIRDISERKELETAILEIAEREQQRIGHDLHDGLGQELTGIAFLSKVLQETLASRGAMEAGDAGNIAAMVNRAIGQTRELARGLYPAELETGGLLTALKQLAFRVDKLYALSCELEYDDAAAGAVTDMAVARHVFRIAQEAVSNAVRHSKAKRIWISLRSSPDHADLTLAVRDDGVGPPPEADTPETVREAAREAARDGTGGLGLHLMSYRARMIGGQLDIRRGSEGGMVLTCVWPVGAPLAVPSATTASAPAPASAAAQE
jgi:PAS domain S-box-containing protein